MCMVSLKKKKKPIHFKRERKKKRPWLIHGLWWLDLPDPMAQDIIILLLFFFLSCLKSPVFFPKANHMHYAPKPQLVMQLLQPVEKMLVDDLS